MIGSPLAGAFAGALAAFPLAIGPDSQIVALQDVPPAAFVALQCSHCQKITEIPLLCNKIRIRVRIILLTFTICRLTVVLT
jgi:hypothetical protein